MNTPTLWMSVMRLMVLLTPFVVMVVDGACQDKTPTMTLSRTDALALAIRNNIDLQVRAIDSSLAKTDIMTSKSIYNPALSASIDYSQTNVAGEDFGTEDTSGALGLTQLLPTGATVSVSTRTGPTSAYADPLYNYTDWATAIGITIYQPLLKNAGRETTELGISQDTYAYEGSLEKFRDNVITTVYQVVTEYNRLYVLYQLLESRKEALLSAQRLLDEINARPTPDTSYKIAVSNAEYALSQRQTELIEAERQVNSKAALVRYLIGLEEKTHIIPLDPPSREEPLETEPEAIALALVQRPDLKEMRIQLQSSELREKVSRKNLWPSLALSASGGYRGYAEDGNFSDTTDQISDGKGRYWAAGLLFHFPIGNDLAESEYLRNKLRSEQLRKQIIAAEWKVRDLIQDDNRSLISARLQLQSTAKSKILAEERVAQYQENRRIGTASVKDLIDAENDLIYARNLELNAIENFAFQVARFWRDVGVLLERQNIRIDTTDPEQVTGTVHPDPGPGSEHTVATASTPAVGTVRSEIPAGPVVSQPLSSNARPVPSVSTVQTKETVSETAAEPMQSAENRDGAAATMAGKSGADLFTLRIGEYFSTELASAKKKIEQAGLIPVVTESQKREREVVRLLIGEYRDLHSAKQALKSLKGTGSGGFILKNMAGGYEAFAGAFFTRHDAVVEQARLAERGITLSLRKVSVALPTYLLTAGSFPSMDAARANAEKLERQGFAIEIRQGEG